MEAIGNFAKASGVATAQKFRTLLSEKKRALRDEHGCAQDAILVDLKIGFTCSNVLQVQFSFPSLAGRQPALIVFAILYFRPCSFGCALKNAYELRCSLPNHFQQRFLYRRAFPFPKLHVAALSKAEPRMVDANEPLDIKLSSSGCSSKLTDAPALLDFCLHNESTMKMKLAAVYKQCLCVVLGTRETRINTGVRSDLDGIGWYRLEAVLGG